jgi:hypothetical protein
MHKVYKYSYILISFYSCIHFFCSAGRSPFRPQDPFIPTITTCWVGDTKEYHLKSSYLESQALFNKFDKASFMDSLITLTDIPYRNQKDTKVSGQEISDLIEELVREIFEHKKTFTHFDVLKRRDFNYKMLAGLLVFKFKEHPFVLKLFIETPEAFVKPFSKGWQPGCFFLMGGGINRYLSGFTRVKNLQVIKESIEGDPEWCKQIDAPRKWFWTPKKCRWFILRGKNLAGQKEHQVTLPSIYGIIADAIKTDKQFNIFNRKHREFALNLCHFLGNRIDPHIDNFMKEENTGKTLLVDTEHFPTMVGLRKPLHFTNYGSWYAQLTAKFVKDTFCRDKEFRKILQKNPPKILPC